MIFLNKFSPVNSRVSRQVAVLSSAASDQFADHEARIKSLEDSSLPWFISSSTVGDPTSATTLTTTSAYATLASLTVDPSKEDGDSYFVTAETQLMVPSGTGFDYRLQRSGFESSTLKEARITGLSGDDLFVPIKVSIVDKPNFSRTLTYNLQIKRSTGAADPEYYGYGLFAIKGWS